MIEIEHEWFKKLNVKRSKIAFMANDFALRNMWDSVTEKYSDKAHFVYELLQNADDAKASTSSFYLTADGLYFKHNGEKHFWVSNPETESEDQENNKLGDINAITSLAQSNKKEQDTIGKFGVGFKAVFQYTKTPHIYDSNFRFEIEQYIVPVELEDDLINREINETVFYFPFNNVKMPAEQAYKDILDKLRGLTYPTLFSNNLQEVFWKTDQDESGTYLKEIKEKKSFENIEYEKIELLREVGSDARNEKIILFSRSIEDKSLSYSIGFFLDASGEKIIPKSTPAFCYYPTKETTHLNFIIHAPFLLTDSREGIKKGQTDGWNELLITNLAQLSADSFLIIKDLGLINDEIIRIIPYKEFDFYDQDSNYHYATTPKFYAPFYDKIKEKLQTSELLPSLNGEYTNRENAFWATAPTLPKLFSNDQLSLLYEKEDAKWIFPSLGYNNVQGTDKELANYISSLSNNSIVAPNTILGKISSTFTERQKNEWLHTLYEYLYENKSYQESLKTKPIFKDNNGNAVAAYNYDNSSKKYELVLFLPFKEDRSTEDEGLYFKTISPDLLNNEKSKEFIKSFGITEPSLKDEIYNHILPLYSSDKGIDTLPHFKKFFNYWKEEGKPEDFINLIKHRAFIQYKTNENEIKYRDKADTIYYPTDDLTHYFESKPNTKFIDLDFYYGSIDEDKQILKEFILKLGVKELPRILEIEISDVNLKSKLNLAISTHGYSDRNKTCDKIIDGCSEIIHSIDKEKSLLLWEMLGRIQRQLHNKLDKELTGTHNYFYYSQRIQSFESTDYTRLKNEKWLLSKDNKFVAPHEITILELADDYEKNIELGKFLGFKPSVILTEKDLIAEQFESLEEAKEAKEALNEKRARQNQLHSVYNKENAFTSDHDFRNKDDYTFGGNAYNDKQLKTFKLDRTIQDLNDLQNAFRLKQEPGNDGSNKKQEIETILNEDVDEDVELAKVVENFKTQIEIKKNRDDLLTIINNNKKYSYEWFKAYLKLLTTYGEKQNTTSQKSITFHEIKPYTADNMYFLLCDPNTYISPEIENAEDFRITLVYGNGKKEYVNVEGVSKKGQNLLIYSREGLSDSTISELSKIFKVEIKFTPVIDLIDRLYKAFTNLNFVDEWQDIQATIPALDYIYGPPGTGKTTTICNKINHIVRDQPNTKVLVLTPTNKAADVVCKKLREISPDIFTIRLSRPTDPELEETIYRDVIDNEDINVLDVVASTIHRLPYFDIKNVGLLFQYKWDYVFFDESSMIGLHYMTFAIMALFKNNANTHFIISGDPKQIPPVVEINDNELEDFEFQDENIYKMMELDSFNPSEQKLREIDTIVNLDIQYRSVPQIGQLFSDLSYSGLLKHERSLNGSSKTLPYIFKNIIASNVTFIDIPLNRDNTIHRVNKLIYSSYQFYSAILVAEMIKMFDSMSDKEWSIGLITPYKAQAILINKLVTSIGISEKTKVYSDTVHGFQGDECDIVFFVCNPNNYYYTGHKKSLLSKEYVYNVAISRAKDYLIIMHPFSEISNNEFINRIGLSYKNKFGNAKIIGSDDIEELLFNEKDYIEKNSYISGHDSVNVFGLSEMKYFIKWNDTAIDIQLHHQSSSDLQEAKQSTTDKNFIKTEIPNIQGLKVVGKIDLSRFEKSKKYK